MMIDASALVAILLREPEASQLTVVIAGADDPFTSPVALYETVAALMRVKACDATQAEAVVREFLETASIRVCAISGDMASRAIGAFERFGKGRHPAGLNLSDCFAYACAKAYSAPLLYKGGDFPQTDVNGNAD